MKTEGKRHKPVEWAFCVCCNKSVRLDDYEGFMYFNATFYKGDVSSSPDLNKIICKECIPRAVAVLDDLFPGLDVWSTKAPNAKTWK